ncbi:paraquat-inducible protein A [Paludisphaera rhizosphaerae]|uniref:hypothetical protein n=1 Tax=Paludisphaera rhizosphaerae TaxID=2711216 RepID=UPI0013EA3695|nr:hypothetical protein [Paludisphaera rhizosphaerae]
MDGEFACPQCGQTVKVRRPGPGRQARCRFCNSLIEVPFLPRVDGAWKRRRFEKPRWVPWAWAGIILAVASLIATATVQALVRSERAARLRTVERLIDSSQAHESAGRFDLALIDLDSALTVAPATGVELDDPDKLHGRRRDLARRDVESVLGKLAADDRPKSLGSWLDLIARVGADHDLEPVRTDVQARFDSALSHWIDDAADRAVRELDPSTALAICRDGDDLALHLPSPARKPAQDRFRAIVAALVDRCGAAIDEAPGEFVVGAKAGYDRIFRPMILETLRLKGYLPPPTEPRWADLWTNPPYRFTFAVRERHEGTYLGTQNRLSRIEARLSLTDRGREIWMTAPNARTIVPVPNLPSYLAGRLALSQDRVEEAEKLLHDNAFSQIRDRFQLSLKNLPDRPGAASTASLGPR